MNIHIGIDPDKGFAVWLKPAKKFLEISTTDFWGIIKKLNVHKEQRHDILVHLEAPYLNKPVWHKDFKSKIAQNVGENKAKAKLIYDWCVSNGFEVVECKPTKKSLTKLTSSQFEQLTGYNKITSEHGRDAAMLVFGL